VDVIAVVDGFENFAVSFQPLLWVVCFCLGEVILWCFMFSDHLELDLVLPDAFQ
jgi:hypothetical protein